ncbi:hypothetical protein [Streptomyces spectabilis]|uniref:Uncharacterized protein n=1 Tax=Streptomyces spectabilis TaxID=68270 RepID=A0A5P2X0N3_STRST|nr:hypothetical protein [Streptomyces spectabilis]MBB5108319.1 hypothetical protein [Streptomyces spectabilis]MCI3901078.1 hypothetical protein [Streptomyces spectabilis]QEV58573.1 hypothetical protein CP982_07480 [Streptomyces spectabilis]GGV45841.1 hypothetical protein GCM10010245_71810 [Streptomyces spectabilis]
MPKTPTPEEIDAAARQVQRGGFLGRGSSRKADQLIDAAGEDGQAVAMQILSAAADHKPRWRR